MCYLLLVNGRVHALDPAWVGTVAAMRDGRFPAVGRGGGVRGPAGPGARLAGLEGRRMLPALTGSRRDGHDRAPGRRRGLRRVEKP
ncbi:MAG: hypothetical protein ABSH53_10780 [Holophaga sp.]|jgi:predicted amidohydrolase YtcJ